MLSNHLRLGGERETANFIERYTAKSITEGSQSHVALCISNGSCQCAFIVNGEMYHKPYIIGIDYTLDSYYRL